MARVWHKLLPPKKMQEYMSVYQGVWMPQMDRYWESEDGYNVCSRLIKTAWGNVEHVTIQRTRGGGDIPWAMKQEIKDELFGFQRVAIEVFPSKKNLIDVCDVYHLWVLPKDFKLPFGIHPFRDPQGEPVERGYDFNLDDCRVWNDSPERAALMENRDMFLTDAQRERIDEVRELIDGKLQG
jgi:hypothetical protein